MTYFQIPILLSLSSLYLSKDKLLKYWLFLKLISVATITSISCYLNFNLSDSFYNLLYNTINENKCLAIKFSQWIISRLNITYDCSTQKPSWLLKFNQFFEDCPSHDFKYTQDFYLQLTNRNILDDYDIDFNCISSGSIGQVYKATHKDTQETHAIKVKHPHLEEYMYLPRLFIKSVIRFLKIITFQQFYIPLDIEMFFVSLEQQLDFNLESENIKKMYANFEDNRLIIIPRIIKYNYDVIIMTYEEGTYFEKYDDISQFNKFKVALTYILFYHQCCYLDNFNHGDLHQGNWKIRLDNNQKDFCLVIYDLGVCYSFQESEYIKKFIESWENYDMDTMAEASFNLIKQNNDVSEHPNFKEELFSIFKDNEFKPFNLNKVLSLIYNCTKKYKLTFDYSTLNILISAGLCEQMLTKYKLMNTGIYEDDDLRVKSKDDTYKSQTLEYINFCQTRKVFPELEQYYRNLLKQKNINLNSLFNNVDLKLNNASQTLKFESTSKQLEI